MTYDAAKNQITIVPNKNTYDGTYDLRLNTFVTGVDSKFDGENFNVEIERNYPPVFKTLSALDEVVTIRNDQYRNWTLEVDHDDMNDIATFDLEVFDVRGVSVNATFKGLKVIQYTNRKISFEIFNTTVPT